MYTHDDIFRKFNLLRLNRVYFLITRYIEVRYSSLSTANLITNN